MQRRFSRTEIPGNLLLKKIRKAGSLLKVNRPLRIAVLTGITAVLFAISLFYMVKSVYGIYQYAYLVPILLACFWFRWAGVVYSVVVAVSHTLLYAVFFRDDLPNEICLAVVFIGLAVFSNVLLGKLDREIRSSAKLSSENRTYFSMMKKAEELSGIGSWRLNLMDNQLIWSDGLYRIFGLDPAVCSPSMKTRFDITYPDDRETVERTLRKCLETGKDLPPWESRIVRPDGSVRWILSTGYTELGADGKPLTYIGSLLDITSSKMYEHRIDEETEKLKITLSSIGDGVIATDGDGNISLLNRQAEVLTGWSQREAHGKPFASVFQTEEHLPDLPEEQQNRAQTEAAEAPGCPEFATLVSRHGTRRPVSVNSAPIKSRLGEILGAVVVFRDTTKEKEQRDRINYISYHDVLTGLYNRRYFEEQLNQIDRKDNLPVSVIMGDLNGLKVTNDAFGHEEGDRLIRQAAHYLRSACREDDIVARWGGDEFVVLLPKTGEEGAETVIRRIRELEQGKQVGLVSVSLSLGAGTKTKESDSLLRALSRAENRMYAEKTETGETVRRGLIDQAMAALFEAFPQERSHAENVADLSERLGRELSLPPETLVLLRQAGYYHDIGKIAEIRLPGEKRKEESYGHREFRRHPEIGYEILRSYSGTAACADAVLSHHEKYGGGGYPRGIAGDTIPFAARIISAANLFDRLCNPGEGLTTMSGRQAARELSAQAGTRLDSRVADALMRLFP